MSLIRNSVYNIAGFAIPTLVAIPALGILARQLGVEKFGLFTLAFAIVGYASIFDGGITRAVIREIAIFRDKKEEQKKIISTASVSVLILGTIAAILLVLFSNNLISFLKVSEDKVIDVGKAFKILGLTLPIYLLNQIWLAYLEGHEKFANLNIQRTITSIFLAVLPLLMCLIYPTLLNAVVGLLIGRIISLTITFSICKKIIIESGMIFYKETFIRMMKFGGWLTVSNIISPIMVYFDRFVVSNMIGASKVAFYSAPAEGVARLVNIPFALSRALFPKLSNSQNKDEKKKLEKQSYILISIICLPIVIFGIFFSKFIMVTWMGLNYGNQAANVLCILLIGFYFNSLAQIPFSVLQAKGKSKTTALIHAIEIFPYLGLLFYMTYHLGLIGTAIAWSVRMGVDLILLFVLSRKLCVE
ncbi:flippase [Acinetobacter baumannii]|uniref:flippase n=1 Tax=Acinetobacter baumannii TaxID=470 RepID=UPI0022EC3F97|nr:flippase [Acinetobacter baumannii]